MPIETIETTLSLKLKSIDKMLSDMPELTPWKLLRAHLEKTTSQTMTTVLGTPQGEFAELAPLVEIAKLPINLRLELATMIETSVKELMLLSPKSKDKDIEQEAQAILATLEKNLTDFAEKNKKITAIGTITTTIAAVGGFLAGAILAPFAPLALAAVARYCMYQEEKSIPKAIGAGIAAFVTGILLAPFAPLLGAALPIIKNTAIFNFQLEEIEFFATRLAKDMKGKPLPTPDEDKAAYQKKNNLFGP